MMLKLQPNPTFPLSVSVPVPGGESETVVFTCRFVDAPTVEAWFKEAKEFNPRNDEHNPLFFATQDDYIVAKVVCGWDLDVPFTKENLDILFHNYWGVSTRILERYLQERNAARLGN